jgi:hypothetical protein
MEGRPGSNVSSSRHLRHGSKLVQNLELHTRASVGGWCEHTGILRALIEYPQGNLEEIQQKTLQSTQEEPEGCQNRKA